MSAVSSNTINNTPNQTGSYPIPTTIGVTMEAVVIYMEKASMTQPNTK